MNKPTKFQSKYGSWALVTGGSSGIGAELARQIAKKGLNVILVARQQERLDLLALEIEKMHGVKVMSIPADLTTQEGIERVKTETETLEVGLLVNNAGREDSGYFLETSLEMAVETLDLNVRAPLQLTHHFVRKMANRRKGGILFMASIVGFQGVPFIANYAATKAWDLIFAESLAAELKSTGIDVSVATPGFTKTELSPDFDFSGLPLNPMPAVSVAKTALGGLGAKRLTVPGFVNKFLYVSGKYLLPRFMNTWSFGMVFRSVLRKKLRGQINGNSLKEESISI